MLMITLQKSWDNYDFEQFDEFEAEDKEAELGEDLKEGRQVSKMITIVRMVKIIIIKMMTWFVGQRKNKAHIDVALSQNRGGGYKYIALIMARAHILSWPRVMCSQVRML